MFDKIDIVYTWVDSTDPLWQEKKNYYFKKENINSTFNPPCRYINNDELKYSLRSLEKYANWINNIYIITDNQIPNWLDINNPRIKIIDHKEIIPNEYLPTFNSVAIEHCITNIKGLSERFLYANDDMFFIQNTKPSFFFTWSGLPYFRFSYIFDSASKNFYIQQNVLTEDIFKKHYKNHKLHRMYSHHNIDAYRKKDIEACKRVFQEEINNTIKSRFRSETDIKRNMYAYYSIHKKRGVYKGIYRADLHLPFYKNKIFNYLKKHYNLDTAYIPCSAENFERFLTPHQKLFCLNDNTSTNEKDRIRAQIFLEKLFPEKSSFEK